MKGAERTIYNEMKQLEVAPSSPFCRRQLERGHVEVFN